MDLTRYEVRHNWQEIDQKNRKTGQRIWFHIVLLVCITTLVLFVLNFIWHDYISWNIIRPYLAPIVFLLFIFLFTSTIKLEYDLESKEQKKFILGLNWKGLVTNILIGGLAGAVLGLNFILLSSYRPSLASIPHFQASILILFFFVLQVFIRALGEECLLRGIGFTSLFEINKQSYFSTAFQIIVLNLVMYLIQIYRYLENSLVIWIVIFRIIYAILAIFLRHRLKSIIPSITCNFFFNLFISSVLPW